MPSNRLDGKTIFVTASAQGIGRASVIAFAEAGATVIATDINQEKLEELEEISNVKTKTLNVLDQNAIRAAAKEFSNVNVVLNCAGHVHHGTILECNEEDWTFAFDMNVKSMFMINQSFLPQLIAKKCGSIINIASVAGSIKGFVNRFAYGATKAAVIGLTKSIAADYVAEGIRANAICPGTIDTPSLAGRMAATGDIEVARKNFVNRQPMNRLGTPEEIANIAVYLASDESQFMTGQTITIDGGITI
mgnify:CR=1 FL=1